jgi:hypothetical protein
MNLLVGLAVDDIASVMRVATVKRLEMRVKLTLDVEGQLPRWHFFQSIRRFRTMTYQSSRWQTFLNKIFRIQIQTQFDKNFARLEDYSLIQTAGNQVSKTTTSMAARNIPKIDDKTKSTSTTTGPGGSGLPTDWITTIHAQINTKYNEFNRHMADLKSQQEKINHILQQFPTSTTSRQSSHLTFTPSNV